MCGVHKIMTGIFVVATMEMDHHCMLRVRVCAFSCEQHASVLQLCWHVSLIYATNVWKRPQYNLTNLLMIHTHSLTLCYTLFALEQLFATHQPCHWNRTESN